MVFENLNKGQKARWLVNDGVKHSMTYTPDAGQATAILGNTESAFGQVWHLPTDRNALTGREFIGRAAAAFGTAPRRSTLSPWMIRLAGLFNEPVRKSVELLYQNDSDYLFDSSKFERVFGFRPTPYDEGFRATADSLK
jgi:nucleoside-diphosphate-sugar epimerase